VKAKEKGLSRSRETEWQQKKELFRRWAVRTLEALVISDAAMRVKGLAKAFGLSQGLSRRCSISHGGLSLLRGRVDHKEADFDHRSLLSTLPIGGGVAGFSAAAATQSDSAVL